MKGKIARLLLGLWLLTYASIGFAIDSTPCWLSNPITESQIGFIGAANPFSSKINGSLIASRKRALVSLTNYYNFKLDLTKIDVKKNQVILANGTSITFSNPYTNRQALYSYATIQADGENSKQKQWLNQQCPIQSCDFKMCQPLWLCNDEILADSFNEGSQKYAVIHGVSQITANPAKQFTSTKRNAQELLKYIIKSDVKDLNYSVKSTGKYQSWGYSEHSGSVEGLGDAIKILNTHSCQTPNYLFARYVYFTPSLIDVKSKSYSQWLRSPNLGKQTGVVGIFDGIVADGRFSSAIKLAIKDGLIELAKTKKITIDHDYQLKYQNGAYSLSKTSMATDAIVSAQLQDIKIIEENNKLVIYAWLLENEDV